MTRRKRRIGGCLPPVHPGKGSLGQRPRFAFPRLVIAGTHSGVGKTSVVGALLGVLGRVQGFKVGPDYIDPAFHTFITGRASRNLDSWLLDAGSVLRLFAGSALGEGGVNIIEGVMGLFDGEGAGWRGSTAELAGILRAPVLLVVSGRGIGGSAAAMVSGYAEFARRAGCRLGGVVINRCSGERHYRILREAIEREAGVKCLGFLPNDAAFSLPSRHLGLRGPGEDAQTGRRLRALAEAAANSFDLEGILALARSAPRLEAPPSDVGGKTAAAGSSCPVRIGVAWDAAFCFYYQDNLELLEKLGAELVFFSPLAAAALPEGLDGLYLGGGYPELHAARLSGNRALREAVRLEIYAGLPAYAECGGMLYLCSTLECGGERFPMAGVFGRRAIMTDRLQPFGYVELEFSAPTLLGARGMRVRAHEFHYSRLEADDGQEVAPPLFTARKGDGRSWEGGLAAGSAFAMYPHVHFYAAPGLAENFVECCRRFKAARQ